MAKKKVKDKAKNQVISPKTEHRVIYLIKGKNSNNSQEHGVGVLIAGNRINAQNFRVKFSSIGGSYTIYNNGNLDEYVSAKDEEELGLVLKQNIGKIECKMNQDLSQIKLDAHILEFGNDKDIIYEELILTAKQGDIKKLKSDISALANSKVLK